MGRRWRFGRLVGGASLVAVGVTGAGCASVSTGSPGGWTEAGGPPASGPPVLVGTASMPVDRDSARPPAAVLAAHLLEAQNWPVVHLDSAANVLVSAWQYFEVPVALALGEGYCQNPLALRFVLRPQPGRADRAQVVAEAYLARSEVMSRLSARYEAQTGADQNDQVARARAVLAAFRNGVVTAAGGDAAAARAADAFAGRLAHGGLQRCN